MLIYIEDIKYLGNSACALVYKLEGRFYVYELPRSEKVETFPTMEEALQYVNSLKEKSND